MWRHGDVLIAMIDEIPKGAYERNSMTLVRGEMTGHSHRIADPKTATVWEYGGEKFLEITAENAQLIHEEHHTITLPKGYYRIWQQREYAPQEIRRIVD